MSLLAKLHATARPGFCACGDPLPRSKGGRARKVCDGCKKDYAAIYGAARRTSEPYASIVKIRKLERLAASLTKRALLLMERTS